MDLGGKRDVANASGWFPASGATEVPTRCACDDYAEATGKPGPFGYPVTLLLGQVRPRGMPSVARLAEGNGRPGCGRRAGGRLRQPDAAAKRAAEAGHALRGQAGLDQRPERDLGLHHRHRTVAPPAIQPWVETHGHHRRSLRDRIERLRDAQSVP